MNKTKKKIMQGSRGGFTLIETLVAVAILMISIAGPLVVANKGLTAAYHARNQATASLLAQEEMELIRNVKDTTIFDFASGKNLNSDFNKMFNTSDNFGSCNENNPCAIWLSDSSTLAYDGNPYHCSHDSKKCLLYWDETGQEPGFFSNGSLDDSPTIFTRSFYVEKIGNSGTESRVHVKVTWMEGSMENAVSISSTMVASVI